MSTLQIVFAFNLFEIGWITEAGENGTEKITIVSNTVNVDFIY